MEIRIDGCVEVDVTEDEFYNRFIEWVESNNWTFGGVTYSEN